MEQEIKTEKQPKLLLTATGPNPSTIQMWQGRQENSYSGREVETWESLTNEFYRLSGNLEKALDDLYRDGEDWANKENEHAKARAIAFLSATGKNREARESIADPFFEKERLAAYLAEARKQASLEKVRSLRTQISALQTIIAARRSELEAHAYNQIGHNQS